MSLKQNIGQADMIHISEVVIRYEAQQLLFHCSHQLAWAQGPTPQVDNLDDQEFEVEVTGLDHNSLLSSLISPWW